MSPPPRRNEGVAPPLATWAWVAAFVGVFALALSQLPHPSEEVYRAYEQRIDAFARASAESEAARVVVLGTSLAYRALPSGEETSARFDGRVRLLKLARPGARFHFYDRLMDRIFAARPDLILVHAELLRAISWYQVEDARQALRLGLRGQWGGRGLGIDPPEFGDCSGRQSDAVLGNAVANLAAEFPPFDGLPRSARRFFARAREAGVRVAILDLPRTERLTRASGDHAGGWRAGLARALAPWPEIGTLAWPQVLPAEYYCDFSHLNPRGRERYLRWFVPALTQLLERPSSSGDASLETAS